MSVDDEITGVSGSTLSQKIKTEIIEWCKVLSVFVPAFFVFSMLFFEQRVIPSESMVPNLQVGDRVITNKMAYGYSRFSVPWGLDRLLPLGEGRIFSKTPKRGDVAVFMHPHWRRVMIKRVIGIPGDKVQVVGERLFLNDEPVPTEFRRRLRYIPHDRRRAEMATEYAETLGDKTYYRHEWLPGRPGDDTVAFIVPEGHLFFVGDNRDNSKDARDTSGHCPPVNGVVDTAECTLDGNLERVSVGFVPIDHVIGRAETVLWTIHRCRERVGLDCPEPRLWKGL